MHNKTKKKLLLKENNVGTFVCDSSEVLTMN